MSHTTLHYAQCWLRRGNFRQMAWLPERFAVTGKYLRLTENGVSEDGWQVTGVGSRLPANYVHERSRDYLLTRRASDI